MFSGSWPEDAIPSEFENCQKCELSKQRSRIIWGEGNPDAEIFVLLDNPGAREDKEGVPFVCGTRETLYAAVNSTGLSKNDLYITYILRCRPLRKYDKELSRSTCIKYLRNQLQLKTPKLLVCLGDVATQAYLGDKEAEVKSLRGNITFHNGIATAFSYHPLAVRRRPVLRKLFLEDWKFITDFYKRS